MILKPLVTPILLMAVVLLVARTSAFAPKSVVSPAFTKTQTQLPMAIFDGDKEREVLTRDTEPEEFFKTNTDKMSDEEKLPIALAGVAFISLPFIAGLIALFAAR